MPISPSNTSLHTSRIAATSSLFAVCSITMSITNSFLLTQEIGVCRSINHMAQLIETRAVTGTIPTLFGGVPGDDAAEMRADCLTLVKNPMLIAKRRELGEAATHDTTFITLDLFS